MSQAKTRANPIDELNDLIMSDSNEPDSKVFIGSKP
jgi:hypothetical protein